MTQAPTAPPTTGRGYMPPYVRQFSVFLPNKVGRLLDLIDTFDGHAVTLAGLNIQDATDHAVVRLITSNSQLTQRLLIREDFRFSITDVVCVELNADQTLLDVCRSLLEVELNLYYTYSLMVRPRGRAVVALNADDTVLAAQILRRKLFVLLGENDLGENATGSVADNPTEAGRRDPVTGNPPGNAGPGNETLGGDIPDDDLTDYQPEYDPETDDDAYPDLPGTGPYDDPDADDPGHDDDDDPGPSGPGKNPGPGNGPR